MNKLRFREVAARISLAGAMLVSLTGCAARTLRDSLIKPATPTPLLTKSTSTPEPTQHPTSTPQSFPGCPVGYDKPIYCDDTLEIRDSMEDKKGGKPGDTVCYVGPGEFELMAADSYTVVDSFGVPQVFVPGSQGTYCEANDPAEVDLFIPLQPNP